MYTHTHTRTRPLSHLQGLVLEERAEGAVAAVVEHATWLAPDSAPALTLLGLPLADGGVAWPQRAALQAYLHAFRCAGRLKQVRKLCFVDGLLSEGGAPCTPQEVVDVVGAWRRWGKQRHARTKKTKKKKKKTKKQKRQAMQQQQQQQRQQQQGGQVAALNRELQFMMGLSLPRLAAFMREGVLHTCQSLLHAQLPGVDPDVMSVDVAALVDE